MESVWTVPSLDDEGDVVFPIGAYFTSVASAMRFYNLVNLRPESVFSNSAGLYVRFFQAPLTITTNIWYPLVSLDQLCASLPIQSACAAFVTRFDNTILHYVLKLT